MHDESICKWCEAGRVRFVSRPKHGWFASAFGSALVVVSVASLVVWVFGFCYAVAHRDEFGNSLLLILVAVWLASSASLLLGVVGGIARRTEWVVACSNCRAVTRAVSPEQIEAAAGSGAAPAEEVRGWAAG